MSGTGWQLIFRLGRAIGKGRRGPFSESHLAKLVDVATAGPVWRAMQGVIVELAAQERRDLRGPLMPVLSVAHGWRVDSAAGRDSLVQAGMSSSGDALIEEQARELLVVGRGASTKLRQAQDELEEQLARWTRLRMHLAASSALRASLRGLLQSLPQVTREAIAGEIRPAVRLLVGWGIDTARGAEDALGDWRAIAEAASSQVGDLGAAVDTLVRQLATALLYAAPTASDTLGHKVEAVRLQLDAWRPPQQS